jgi:hypothetical protein
MYSHARKSTQHRRSQARGHKSKRATLVLILVAAGALVLLGPTPSQPAELQARDVQTVFQEGKALFAMHRRRGRPGLSPLHTSAPSLAAPESLPPPCMHRTPWPSRSPPYVSDPIPPFSRTEPDPLEVEELETKEAAALREKRMAQFAGAEAGDAEGDENDTDYQDMESAGESSAKVFSGATGGSGGGDGGADDGSRQEDGIAVPESRPLSQQAQQTQQEQHQEEEEKRGFYLEGQATDEGEDHAAAEHPAAAAVAATAIEDDPKYHVVVISGPGVYNQWQIRASYYWYRQAKAANRGSPIGGFTRLLIATDVDELIAEIPTMLVEPQVAVAGDERAAMRRPHALQQWTRTGMAGAARERFVLLLEPDQLLLMPPAVPAQSDRPVAFPLSYVQPGKEKNAKVLAAYLPAGVAAESLPTIGELFVSLLLIDTVY